MIAGFVHGKYDDAEGVWFLGRKKKRYMTIYAYGLIEKEDEEWTT